MLARRCAASAPVPSRAAAPVPVPSICLRAPRLQLPLVHLRTRTRTFQLPPDEWCLDPKNFSLTHHIPYPPPPKREPPHPWRLVPAKRAILRSAHLSVIPAGLTVEKFLKKIGRGCEEHADKFESWEELMGARSWELKMNDIPVGQRKWILKVCQRLRTGSLTIPKHTWKYREGRLDAWRWDYPEVSEW